MAREIVWSSVAESDRKAVLAYWVRRNGSNTYSIKLFALFREAVQRIGRNPGSGRPTDIDGIRMKLVDRYCIFYEVFEDRIVIHHIWDGRRDLSKLPLRQQRRKG